ncbi:fatty acyl-AMP ligase [Nocardia anaemiae]|uniref:fatty acyl-AMP ligase n=1 Tax=Nocardia anaemiae TaxID=263910 RepID=UPI0007A3B0A8|nr:fatty acyl-AMP ligase [Nocardia anaemiae]
MTSPNTTRQTNVLVTRVAEWARIKPNDSAYTELRYRGRGCTPVTLTYEQLHHATAAQAERIRATTDPGDRVAILCAHGIDYVIAFLACLYSNRIAVPLFPPTVNRNRARLEGVLDDARPALSLISPNDTTTSEIFGPELGQVLKLAPHTSTRAAAPTIGRTETAYLQYTSGSTKSPAGVEVSHANLAAALDQLWTAVPAARTEPIVSWLPFFHDMGLILALSLPLYSGVHGITMAPGEFVKRPVRWLRALSDYRAGTTGSPNFGLTLAISATTHEERADLDLSHLDALLNGAEPIRAEALADFTAAFAPYGFRHHAHTPGFGLAEATLSVTVCAERDEPVTHRFDRAALAQGQARTAPEGVPLVGCGVPVGQRVAVVEPNEHTEVAAGIVGEIWVRGPNVCAGYYNNPEATAATFRANLSGCDEFWLRTGDLGFWHEGQLYIAGRLKDLIVIDGRNHYPADIESTVSDCAPELRVGHITAFGHDDGHREDLVVVAELADPAATGSTELARRIRNAIAAAHEVTPGAVVLVEPGRIPKTSSGKLRRGECRALYRAGHLTQP